jgi:hypothetical protein
MLAHQISEEAAVDGIGAVEAAVRRVIQKNWRQPVNLPFRAHLTPK